MLMESIRRQGAYVSGYAVHERETFSVCVEYSNTGTCVKLLRSFTTEKRKKELLRAVFRENEKMIPMGGIEPTTLGLLDPRSNQLSYIGYIGEYKLAHSGREVAVENSDTNGGDRTHDLGFIRPTL